ncbi:MAG: S8 family serine peptidase [Flavisolibacter sp.]
MNNDQKVIERNDQPLWINRKRDPDKFCRYEKLISDTYKKNEIIIFFKATPTAKEIDTVKESFREFGIDPKKIKVKKCDNCKIPVMLFQADGIHTFINGEGVRAGSGPPSSTVGEKYSLNFFNYSPFDQKENPRYKNQRGGPDPKKEKIVVAVLDTGFDSKLVDPKYLWTGSGSNLDSVCYKTVSTGWNFIEDNANFNDDSANKHGSIVSQYIINQFQKSPKNSVQIMPLKTHDKNGIGELFGIICAIHFAIAKGAHIINASWGFYYYFQMPIPYLQELITTILPRYGILFVTASGNRIDEEDIIARQIYFSEFGINLTADQLRNLEIHNFYPAQLSNDKNNVVTVTTTNGKTVTPTQNYSEQYADLGVIADKVTKDSMQFKVPFTGSSDLISGSSFATAIASGIIGAFTEKTAFSPAIRKSVVLNNLTVMGVIKNEVLLATKHIKKGACTKKLY